MTPDEVKEACARFCEELGRVTMMGRPTTACKRIGKARRRAFLNAAEVLRSLTARDLEWLLATNSLTHNADRVIDAVEASRGASTTHRTEPVPAADGATPVGS